MARELQPIDISQNPDLIRLTDEVRAANQPRPLQRDHTTVALLVPVQAKRTRKTRDPQADFEAFLASAGGWRDLVDAEQLKKDIKEARGSDRPPVSL
jgi:hypothetical protein